MNLLNSILRLTIPVFGVLLGFLTPLRAEADPFAPYLDGKAPEIVREVASTNAVPENITVRRVVFRSRDDSEIFAVIATPKTPGKHPGMLVQTVRASVAAGGARRFLHLKVTAP